MTGTANFKVYKSSAGSGKTYTLVKEYLKVVLANPDKMHEVLAITFTNAAAAQMKSRIIKELRAISSFKPSIAEDPLENDLLKQIIAENRQEKEQTVELKTLIENAGKVLDRILHNYSDFSVSTIDSFVHRIVRSFAFDLHVPVNFEVESDGDRLLSQAVDLVIGETGNNKELTRFLVDFVSRQAEEDKSLGVEKMIGNLAKTLIGEDSQNYIEKLQGLELDDFIKIQKDLTGKVRKLESQLQQMASGSINIIVSQGILPESFYQGRKGLFAFLERLSNGDYSKVYPNSYVLATIYEDKWTGGKASKQQKDVINSVKGVLQSNTERILKFIEENFATHRLLKAVSNNIFPLGVLNEVKRMLEDIKRDNGLLHFSDFNKKISKIVAEQPVPFIYERVGERYKHYMIDEFQDTSTLQWQNLLPLVDNGLSGGNRSLVVGDGKQAIYRWRGGEVGQFVNLPEIPREIRAESRNSWQNSLQRNYREEFLDKNWRSRENVVEFNNRFFDFASKFIDENHSNIYHRASQQPAKKGSGGFVHVTFLPSKDYNKETIKRVVATVERLHEEGHPLSDITVLCRSNKNGSLVAKSLMINKIPVISPDSLLLNQSNEVIFILSLLKLLANKNDVVAACEAMNFLVEERRIRDCRNLHEVLVEEGLFPVFSNQAKTNWQQILSRLLSKHGIGFEFESLAHLSAYDATQEIIRVFFINNEPSPFVNFFVDHLLDFSEKANQGVKGFLEWWDESSANFSVVTPDGVDAVRVMSIHKSKGLEFPVVIFPFANAGGAKLTKDGFWIEPQGCPELQALPAAFLKYSQKELEGTIFEEQYVQEKGLTMLDNMNLFYVAFTRAEEKLFVFSKEPTEENTSSLQSVLKQFVTSQEDFEVTDSDGQFTFGKTWIKKGTGQQKVGEQYVLGKFFSRIWSDSLRVASKQEGRGGASYESRERGILLHSALERVHILQDLRPVMESFVSQGLLEENIARDWEKRLREIISDGNISDCFSDKANIKTEPGLFDQNGNFWRPDRVSFFKDKTVVIDYKSGQEHHHHKKQVENYAEILEEMGYQNVKKYLLYLDEPKLVGW